LKVKVVLQNPLDKADTLDYNIQVDDGHLGHLWYTALQDILRRNRYLEKNFCFLGFPDGPRDLDYICKELDWAKNKINNFFGTEYTIEENYAPTDLRTGLNPNQQAMNRLHNHFEHLQGTVWGLSDWYKRADYETKFAIRQLNNLCHEAESLMLSQRKKAEAPEWIRPSQITTFLNTPRLDFPAECKQAFDKSRYDRVFGGVYLHWSQIGKTMYEVYIDEEGEMIDQAMCDAITHLRYYSGEFDIEWARDVTYGGNYPWHKSRMDGFADWLERNKLDPDNREYNFGYHQVGQVESLGTPEETWALLSPRLDIVRIEAGDVAADYKYSWSDTDYYSQQIERLKPGYDYSSRG
jgi:hypothetical protein